jgi:hypothetical protein
VIAGRRAIAAGVALVVASGFAARAHATVVYSTAPPTVDPAHAQAAVETARKQHAYMFCKSPRQPLSFRARTLCGHADSIPECSGFAAACNAAAPPSRHWNLPPWVGEALGAFVRVVAWVLVFGLVLALLVPIVRVITRMRKAEAPAEEDDRPNTVQPALADETALTIRDEDLLLERAGEHARRGENDLAVQLYLAASLCALDKRGALRIGRDRTNGEYVRSCSEAASKPALRDIVIAVDRVQFGREPATGETVARAADRARAIVRALPAALGVLAMTMLLGCGGVPRSSHAGDDPAGEELLYDLLRAQGFKPDRLHVSLASLSTDDTGAAVIVDLDRTDIDDDTREHLVEWVEAGGSLVLAGYPATWPKEFGASASNAVGSFDAQSRAWEITAKRLIARKDMADDSDTDDDDDDDTNKDGNLPGVLFSPAFERGKVLRGASISARGADDIAWFDDARSYALAIPHGKGWVVGIADDELLTNAGLARTGNAALAIAILSNANRAEFRIAQPEDGMSPPSTPIAALRRAGLGLGLIHALAAAMVLFLAEGVRLRRPRPSPPPQRRAFVEHVEAVGTLYARTHSAAHALSAYAQFAEERVHARMPRGGTDVAAFLASRARLPLDVCQRVWARATGAKDRPPAGDELAILKELRSVYSTAMEQEKG